MFSAICSPIQLAEQPLFAAWRVLKPLWYCPSMLASSRQGRVSDTSSKSMGQTLQKVIAAASTAQAEFGDSFVSTEHLLLALAREDNRFTKKALQDQARGEQEILEAVKNIRGPQKVTSRNPEAAYEVWFMHNANSWCCSRHRPAVVVHFDTAIGRDLIVYDKDPFCCVVL